MGYVMSFTIIALLSEEDENHYAEDGTDEDEEVVAGEEDAAASTTARPRRMSELKIVDKVKPIPNTSSMFVLSSTNR